MENEQDIIWPEKSTLAEAVNDYLLRAGNINRKYYVKFLKIGQDVYKKLYATIMPTTISKYVQVFPADTNNPYPYIKRPAGMTRFFGVDVTNKHHELLAVYQNEKLNVFTKPTVQKECGCTSTDLCDCIDNLEVVRTEKFTFESVTYYENTWVKCCANGDVLQYTENPVLDEDDEVVVLKSYKNLGRLATKDCGCPLETEENMDLIYNKCGCFLGAKPNCCKVWYNRVNRVDCTGEYKWSECGTKLYLKNVKDDDGFAVIHYQVDPVKCGAELFIDDFARWPLWYGIDYESSVFNPRSNPKMLREQERRYTKAVNEYFEYLNPMSERIFEVTAEVRL